MLEVGTSGCHQHYSRLGTGGGRGGKIIKHGTEDRMERAEEREGGNVQILITAEQLDLF